MRVLLLASMLAAPACSQYLIDAARLPAEFRSFQPIPFESALQCEARPTRPRIGFGFRFQGGYVVSVPLKQFSGSGHTLAVLTRVTPEAGGPAFLLSVIRLGRVDPGALVADIGGSYFLGEGRYTVDLLLYDDRSRACRKQFRLEAKRSRAERSLSLRIQPGEVRSLSTRFARAAALPAERPYRITVLVNAAPLYPRASRLRAGDREILLGTLGPLLELLPAESVRLVMFSLDQHKTLLTRDDFKIEDLVQVWQSLNGLELGIVDYSVISNPKGHIDLLADLINQELHGDRPPDRVIFLGPVSRFIERFPREALTVRGGADDPRLFYVQYRPLYDRGAFGDIIESAVRFLKGKVFHVHTPVEFGAALRQIATP